MNPKHFSFTDLMQYPAFKMAAKLDDKETMENIFWDLGLDTTKDYEIIWCTHRAVTTNIPQDNYCVFGQGRTDSSWLKSGHASKEDYAMSVSDSDLRDELLNMGAEGAYTVESDFDSDNYLDEELLEQVNSLEGEEVGSLSSEDINDVLKSEV